MHKKIRVAVLFGGRSAEHEVSLQSAKNVINAIDKEKYEVVPIGIDKSGQWLLGNSTTLFLNADNPKTISLQKSDKAVALLPDARTQELVNLSDRKEIGKIDVVFPVLHGTYGEDGTIQGLLKLANVPFVGAGVLGSAVGMDKDVMKRLLRDAGIPVAKFIVCKKDHKQNIVILGSEATPESLSGKDKRETKEMLDPASMTKERIQNDKNVDPWFGSRDDEIAFENIKQQLGLPFFVKPANLGSSIGISKVHDESEFGKAIDLAFQYDRKIIIEEYIAGKEVFCAVLGNDEVMVSVPGQLETTHEFYDYSAKYIDEIEMKIPAPLPESVLQEIQELAKNAVKVLCCEGMARVDVFVTQDHKLILNEINTIPGFTEHSWYPKLWEASGISQTELIDRLIQLALERFEREKKLQTNYQME